MENERKNVVRDNDGCVREHDSRDRKETHAMRAAHGHGGEREHCGCGHSHEAPAHCDAEHGHDEKHEHCGCGHDHGHSHGHAHVQCSCGHDHGGRERTIGRIPLIWIQMAAALGLLVGSFFVNDSAKLWMCLAGVLVVGLEIAFQSVKSIARGEIFDENFLMLIAAVGAFAIGEYPEALGVMLFYRVGEYCQDLAVERSEKNIRSLMDLRPDVAHVLREGTLVDLPPEEVQVGELVSVRPGERIPLDGELCSERTSADTSALTGESVPREYVRGDELLSGAVNLDALIEVRVTKPFAQSTVQKILDLVENASERKSKSEHFITKFAKIYTPVVVCAAILLAVVPCFFTGFGEFSSWLHRALTFLVISCPCALVLSVPLSFIGGIGGASKLGVLMKGSQTVEALSRAEIAVFDKTGTLTKGKFEVTELRPAQGVSAAELLAACARAEQISNHPIAQSILRAYAEQGNALESLGELEGAREVAGYGIEGTADGERLLCGKYAWMAENGVHCEQSAAAGTVVYAALGGRFLGAVLIADTPKPDSAGAVAALKAAGVRKTVMLTGDSQSAAAAVGEALGLDEVRAELLPQDKVAEVERLLGETTERGKLIFVGDGVNDAPVIARADVGVAMGGVGSDAAIEAADVVLMTDEPSKLAKALRLCRKTMRIVRANIVFALAVKAAILVLGALGYASMWLAVFADVGVSLLCVLNALRALRVKRL